VLVAPTRDGAISVWETAQPGGLPMQYRRIDRDGHPLASASDLPATGAQYGALVAAAPNGDVVVVWTEWHYQETPAWRVLAIVLGADGTPRGEATRVLTDVNPGHPRLAVGPSGDRALFVYDDEQSIRALSLECVR
jgi:hypothetical protein